MNKLAKILVVDDEAYSRKLMSLILEDFEVTAVEDVDSALSTLREKTFELIITDMRMPKKSGLDLIEAVRGEISSTVPIIVITGHYDSGKKRKELEKAAFVVLEKPFDDEELLKVVERALGD